MESLKIFTSAQPLPRSPTANRLVLCKHTGKNTPIVIVIARAEEPTTYAIHHSVVLSRAVQRAAMSRAIRRIRTTFSHSRTDLLFTCQNKRTKISLNPALRRQSTVLREIRIHAISLALQFPIREKHVKPFESKKEKKRITNHPQPYTR